MSLGTILIPNWVAALQSVLLPLGERGLSSLGGLSCSVTIASGIVLVCFPRSLGAATVDLYLGGVVSGTYVHPEAV